MERAVNSQINNQSDRNKSSFKFNFPQIKFSDLPAPNINNQNQNVATGRIFESNRKKGSGMPPFFAKKISYDQLFRNNTVS